MAVPGVPPPVELPSPARVLFLVADTGGGHRASARAVIEALRRRFPGRFAPIVCDPLCGPRAGLPTRLVAGLYGPVVRWAPWLWGAVFHGTGSRAALRLLRATVLAGVNRPVADAVRRHRPDLIVSCHPLTGRPALLARDRWAPSARVVTVVTDLVRPHRSWQDDPVDRLVVPPTVPDTGHPARAEIGLPVASAFTGPARDRATLRRSLGLDEHRFLVVLAGGGEGAGGIGRAATAILRHTDDIGVVALCGRNRRLRRKLAAVAGDRLTVRGFVPDMANWLRCADVVVGKAGPGLIAEATACGVPMVLTSHLPGQERGNIEFVVEAGAGRSAPTTQDLVREITALHGDPASLAAMRAASARIGRPGAAAGIADLLADVVRVRPVVRPEPAEVVRPWGDENGAA